MPSCTVYRTHENGRLCPKEGMGKPLAGPVRMYSVMHAQLRRQVSVLTLDRLQYGGREAPPVAPDLIDPVLLTFSTEQGLMFRGAEEIDGRWYVQGWWIRWHSDGSEL